ncbi:MAG TPA: RNA methyltransferase [Microscillaceae bacterium]|jgi:TrmH family RNA methyltransferase|nr:RNA methyltransferase [Microscillaceae bacterium]
MLSKNQQKFIRSLHQKKFRQEANAFLVEGEKNLVELLQSDWRQQLEALYCTAAFAQKYTSLLPDIYQIASAEALEQAGSLTTNNQGLAVVALPPKLPSLPDLEQASLVLALHDLQDPGNLGTILRTADWYGIQWVFCSPQTVDLYNPKVISATKGAFLRVKVVYYDLEVVIKHCRQQQIPVYAAALGGRNLHTCTFGQRGGLVVVGNESAGLPSYLCQLADHTIAIPKFGQAESLNVAVAAAVLLDNMRRS